MRNLRKKFRRPKKSWNIDLIKETKDIRNEYGLKATKELLAAKERLSGFRGRARRLIAVANEEEKKLLIDKLVKLGMLKPGAGLDDVLALDVKSMLERRLQTLVFKKNMALSVKHARQIITHGLVSINHIRIKFPSYIVTTDEEPHIGWYRGEPKKPEIKKQKHAARGQVEAAAEQKAEEASEGEAQ